jgi:hypothetical protein
MGDLMKAILAAFLLFMTLIQVTPAEAQSRTKSISLRDANYVPLYDCSIFRSSRDQRDCEDLARGENVRFENEGYAFNCYDLSRSRQSKCLVMATDILYNDRAIECNRFDDRCKATKAAYREGSFFNNYREEPVYRSTTTCDMAMYDRAHNNWSVRNEEQMRKGSKKATIGLITTIGGLLLSTSRNNTVSAIGTGVAIGGVFLTTWGLVEMIDAESTYPHLDSYCKTNWESERRTVIVERQECVTTRYSERGYNSSRYYYEVNCSNKRYVTFEEFEPWNEGRSYSSSSSSSSYYYSNY